MNDEIEIKKEAIWALSNTTSNATPSQFMDLVDRGMLKCLIESLKLNNLKILAVALEGIENVLKCG